MNKQNLKNLVEHLQANPQIKKVWFNEKGEWYFNAMPGTEAKLAIDVIETGIAVLEDEDSNEEGISENSEAISNIVKENGELTVVNNNQAQQIEELQAEKVELEKTIKELSEANDAWVLADADKDAKIASLEAELAKKKK